MHSKNVLLLLAALQVACSSQWERPHIRYYSRWSKGNSHSLYEHQPRSHYEDSRERDCESHHSEEVTPVHEDQDESAPRHFPREEETQYDDVQRAGHTSCGRLGHDDCEIFVNPIRPPHSASIRHLPEDDISAEGQIHPVHPAQLAHNLPVQKLLAWPGFISRPTSGLPEGPGEDLLHEVPLPPIIPQLAVPGELIAPDVQACPVPNLQHSPGLAAPGTGVTPLLPFLPSGAELPLNQPFTGPEPLPLGSPNLPALPSPGFCIRHRLVPVPVSVHEECITNVPVVRKILRHQVETVTRHMPITEKTVIHQNEKIIRHVPIAGKTLRNVVETRVRHIPVIKSRTRTVVEPYTVHVPVTIRFTRPVEESITKSVPVQEVRTRPVVTQSTRLVPVVERTIRPIVEQRIDNVPVKRKFLRTVVEQRIRPVAGPCQPCLIPLPLIGIPMSQISPADIPRILLSPYADLSEAGDANSLGAELSQGIDSAGNSFNPGPIQLAGGNPGILSGPINGQIVVGNPGILCGQPGRVNADLASMGSSAAIGIPPNAHQIISNLPPHPSTC